MTSHSHIHAAERWISRILRAGIILSSLLMIAGLLTANVRPDSGNAATLMSAGLLVLMLTPFLRVASTAIVFMIDRDWKFVAIALFVFTMLVGEIMVAFL